MIGPLPTVPSTADPTLLAQYNALVAGTAKGGNFQQFKDLAEQGGVPDSLDGYAQYLTYNGGNSAAANTAVKMRTDFQGWNQAAIYAYAIVNKQHQSNNLSPLWDPPSAIAKAISNLRARALTNGWQPAQTQAAIDSFAEHFPRILRKWGYTGSIPAVVVPQTPPPQPTTPTYNPRTSVDVVDFAVTRSTAPFRPGFPVAIGDGLHFPVIAWRIRTWLSGGGLPAEYQFSPWQRYAGLVVNRVSSDTAASEFVEDLPASEVDKIAAAPLGGPPPVAKVDTLAASTSTSYAPVTAPAGTLPTTPPNLQPETLPTGVVGVSTKPAGPQVLPEPLGSGVNAPTTVKPSSSAAAENQAASKPVSGLWAVLAVVAGVFLLRRKG